MQTQSSMGLGPSALRQIAGRRKKSLSRQFNVLVTSSFPNRNRADRRQLAHRLRRFGLPPMGVSL